MRARAVPSFAAVLWICLASPSYAFDPSTADVLGLRLGMDEQQVAEVLEHQGVPAKRITRRTATCPDDSGCDTIINVTTGDGALTINMSVPMLDHDKPAAVSEISYAFKGWSVGEPRAIAESVLEHFGRPAKPDTMIWCQYPSTDLQCPARQPTLRFVPDKLLLVLSSGVARR